MATVDHSIGARWADEPSPQVDVSDDEARDRVINALGAVGWFTRGVVSLAVAGIVLRVGWTDGSEAQQPTKSGVLNTLSDRSGGLVLVALLGIGALAYAVVRFVPIALYRRNTSWQQRGQAVAAAVLYLPLAFSAFHVLRGEEARPGLGGNEQETNEIGASLLQHTWGTFLLAAGGLGLLIYGAYQIYKGIAGTFVDKLETSSSAIPELMVRTFGTIGFAARGVIACALGLFLGWAAVADDSSSVHSIDGAVRQFTSSPAGKPLLTLVSIGLACFAGYCMCAASTRPHEKG